MTNPVTYLAPFFKTSKNTMAFPVSNLIEFEMVETLILLALNCPIAEKD